MFPLTQNVFVNVVMVGRMKISSFFLSKPFSSLILVVIISFLQHTIFEKILSKEKKKIEGCAIFEKCPFIS